MSVGRHLLLLGLVATCSTSASAQVISQPAPWIQDQIRPEDFKTQLQSVVPLGERTASKDPVTGFLTWALVGVAVGTVASFLLTCTYSTDKSCVARTIGLFAVGGGFIGLLGSL